MRPLLGLLRATRVLLDISAMEELPQVHPNFQISIWGNLVPLVTTAQRAVLLHGLVLPGRTTMRRLEPTYLKPASHVNLIRFQTFLVKLGVLHVAQHLQLRQGRTLVLV